MADKFLKIAVMLSAVDNMTSVVNRALDGATDRAKAFEDVGKLVGEGMGLLTAGGKGLAFMGQMTDAFGHMQEAANDAKAVMMTDGGVLDENLFKRVTRLSENLSDKYQGTTADYLDMVRVLKSNRVDEKDVLGGIGEATAKLSFFFKEKPAEVAEFAARMRTDMGVAVGDMGEVMDLVARLNGVGVGKTGAESVNEMTEFFSKVGLGLSNLRAGGINTAKDMGALGAVFMQKGLSGQVVGTNFRRILDGLANPEKLAKVNALAAGYGKHFEFFDKAGNFKSVANFVAQLGQLNGLKPEAIGAILEPFAGKQGLSTDFLQYLGSEGVVSFNGMNQRLAHQGTLTDKVQIGIGGLNNQQKIMASTWQNAKAAFGAGMAPALTSLYGLLNRVGSALRNFLELHPRIAQFAGAFVTFASAGMMIMGVIKIIQAITIVMRILNITMLANPFMLIATLAIAAVALLYTYWDKIPGWWNGILSSITGFFKRNWGIIKAIIAALFWPAGIFLYWGKISGWFNNILKDIKGVFLGFLNWFFVEFPLQFLIAGAKIVDNIANGIKSGAGRVWDAIKGIAKAIRDFFPFSPAKEGPLKDLHKVRIVETIASAMKPGPAITAARGVAGAIAGNLGSLRSQGSGGGITLNYTPSITINGQGSRDEFMSLLNKHKADIVRMLASIQNRNNTVSF